MAAMHGRWMVECVFVIVMLCAGFENSAMRQRKRALQDAVEEIKVPIGSYSQEEIQCAACEAVSRNLADAMSSGRHKAGAVERIAVLYEACEGIETKLPAELPPKEDGGDKVLHFWTPQDMEALRSTDVSKIGMKQYCNTLVEEFEDAIVEEMTSAKEVTSMTAVKGLSRYSMVEALCVRATPSCSDDSLNRITESRLVMGMKNSDAREQLTSLLKQQMGKPGAMPPKVPEAPKAPKAAKGSKARKLRESTQQADASAPKGLNALISWLRGLIAQSPMIVLASGATVTTTAVYVGGMVARVW